MSDVSEKLKPYLDDGFGHYALHEHFTPGVRVHNRGERYPEARQFGTGNIVAVLRKPGRWEVVYDRLNIEILVRRDDSSLSFWADYGTYLPEGCWHCKTLTCDHAAKVILKEDNA